MTYHEPTNSTIDAREFENDAEAIAYARSLIERIGLGDFQDGTVLAVSDETGKVIIEIPIVRHHR